MKSLCAVVLGLAAAFTLTGSAKADDTAKLLGKWEVTKAESDTPVGTLVEFQKDGKLAVVVPQDGKELKLTGTYKYDGKKLKVSVTINEEKLEREFTVKFKGDDDMEFVENDKTDVLKKKK